MNSVTKIYVCKNSELSNKNICMCFKMRQVYVTNWGSFVLLQIRANIVTNWGIFFITNWGKCCYKLRELLQLEAKRLINWGRFYKLGQSLQIEA